MISYRDQDATGIEDDIDCVTGHKKVLIKNLNFYVSKCYLNFFFGIEIKMDESH